jgi:myo-inositol 2-dehydrogenase/D-chiro-inositol 1-dehydrogenase
MITKFALLGAGFIGKEHARCISANPRAKLSSVCDPSEENGQALAARYGANYSPKVDSNILAGVDAVLIASATDAHAEQIRLAASCGKAILCEKPISGDFAAGLDAVRSARAAKVFGAAGFNRRFLVEHALLKQAIADRDLGRLETIRITVRLGEMPPARYIRDTGGLFHSVGSHFFDLACWLAGEDPAEVYAVGSNLVDETYRDAAVFDTSLVTLVMQSGALVGIELSVRSDYGYDERIEVHGSAGTGFSDAKRLHGFTLAKRQAHRSGPLLPTWFDRMGDSYARELDSFIDGLSGKTHTCASLADGLRSDIVAVAATESASTGKVVRPDWSVLDGVAARWTHGLAQPMIVGGE